MDRLRRLPAAPPFGVPRENAHQSDHSGDMVDHALRMITNLSE